MSELTLQELEAAASAYEELLVPSLFQAWARRVAEAAELREGQRVLDVACGTGVLARAVAERIGPSGSVTGVDINPGMLRVAERVAPEIEWREGSVESLPLEDASFDAVVSQFGLMLFPDRRAALQEMMRVLKSGGRLTVAVFDSLANNQAYDAIASAYGRVVDASTADALRYPFSLGDTKELSALMADGGLPAATLVTETRIARFPSVRHTVLADVKGWFPLANIHLDDSTVDAVVAEVGAALDPFVVSDGAVEFPVSVHVITGTKP